MPWWVVLGIVMVVFMAGVVLGITLGAKALQDANSVIDQLFVQVARLRGQIEEKEASES